YEVLPGNSAIVHHMAAMVVDPDLEIDDGLTNLDLMTAYDHETPDRPGWPCIGGAGDDVVTKSVPIGWAPGQGVVDFPTGSGSPVEAGDMLVVQIHYNMAAGLGHSDSTTINFRFEPEVEREALSALPDGLLFTLFDDDPHALPPGSSEEIFTWSFLVEQYADLLDSDRIELWGVFPHMHNAGVGLRARVLDEHGHEVGCLVDVFRWEYQWQLYYFYQQPIPLEVGQTVEVTCVYDTSRETEPI